MALKHPCPHCQTICDSSVKLRAHVESTHVEADGRTVGSYNKRSLLRKIKAARKRVKFVAENTAVSANARRELEEALKDLEI